ncbi:DsrE family protein [Modestobacter versicolor]|uniref:DsrE family protein n=1 Tax=Modestobacter versicolor TaxID=429133 RepID=UPI0034DEA46F
MARTPVAVLGVVEQPYRGSTERAYVDCFYLARVLNAQLGDLDLLLRGEAVLVALQGEGPAADPTAALQHLLDDGVDVLLDGDDLDRLGLDRADLLAGVQVTSGEHARSWHQYQAVWFL